MTETPRTAGQTITEHYATTNYFLSLDSADVDRLQSLLDAIAETAVRAAIGDSEPAAPLADDGGTHRKGSGGRWEPTNQMRSIVDEHHNDTDGMLRALHSAGLLTDDVDTGRSTDA